MSIEFIGLGYGTEETLNLSGLYMPFVLIRDDDAAVAGAEDCWFAAMTSDRLKAEKAYESTGGTVSYSRVVTTVF